MQKKIFWPSIIGLFASLAIITILALTLGLDAKFTQVIMINSVLVFLLNIGLFVAVLQKQKNGKKPETVLFASMGLYPAYMIILFLVTFKIAAPNPTFYLISLMVLYIIYKAAFVTGVNRLK